MIDLARGARFARNYCGYAREGGKFENRKQKIEHLFGKFGNRRQNKISKYKEMKSTKVQTLGGIWRKYWNIWIENNFSCIRIR